MNQGWRSILSLELLGLPAFSRQNIRFRRPGRDNASTRAADTGRRHGQGSSIGALSTRTRCDRSSDATWQRKLRQMTSQSLHHSLRKALPNFDCTAELCPKSSGLAEVSKITLPSPVSHISFWVPKMVSTILKRTALGTRFQQKTTQEWKADKKSFDWPSS